MAIQAKMPRTELTQPGTMFPFNEKTLAAELSK
jgi:hypothetical protein